MTEEEYARFLGLLWDAEARHGSARAAGRACGIAYASFVGLLDGKRPLVEHEWGLARGLDLEPEQLVAVVRGRSILCGESLSDQLAQAPRSTQIEAIESVMRAWKVEYYG